MSAPPQEKTMCKQLRAVTLVAAEAAPAIAQSAEPAPIKPTVR